MTPDTDLLAALAASGMICWQWDLESGGRTYSADCARFFGASPSPEAGSHGDLGVLVHPDDQPRLAAAMEQAIGATGELEAEFRGAVPAPAGVDGYRWFCVTGRVQRDAAGKPLRMVGTTLDVTERQRHKRSSRRNDALFEIIVESSADAITVTDHAGKVLYRSPSCYRLLGYEPPASDADFEPEVHPDDAGILVENWRRAIACKARIDLALLRFRHRDGSWRWVEGNAIDLKADPQVNGIVITWRDVTARVEAEDALRRREALFRALVENGFDAITLLSATGEILFRGNNNARVLGTTDAESVNPYEFGNLHPEDAEVAKATWQTLLRTPGERSHVLVRAKHSSGGWVWIEATACNLLHDANIQAVLVVWRDVTHRKDAEERARETQILLSKAQEAGRIGCWWSDPTEAEGRLYWTKEVHRITGVPEHAFDGQLSTFFSLVHPDDVDRVRAASLAALHGGKPYDVEHRFVRPDGEIVWVLERADVFFDVAGRPVQMIGICQDITERKRLETQLAQAQKLESVGRLAGGIAHDFNNLLTIILGHSNTLSRKIPPEPTFLRHLEAVQTAAQRGSDLVKRMLAFGRRRSLAVQSISLADSVAEAETILRPTMDARIELVVARETPPVVVRADPSQVLQVVVNLALNARDAMPDGGRLTIATSRVRLAAGGPRPDPDLPDGEYGVLSVTDTGAGMTREVMAHLFEPFFTTKGVGEGTGLGLASCYGIAKQHSGGIGVHSKVGKGTTIDVFLPLERPGHQKTAAGEAAAPQPAPHDGQATRRGAETALVVEDERLLRELLTEAMVSAGYKVIAAADGEQALAASVAHQGPIELLVTDVIMPHVTGPELARQLREARPDLRVLFMSGYQAHETTGTSGRADAFLQKPFALTALLRTIRELLDRP